MKVRRPTGACRMLLALLPPFITIALQWLSWPFFQKTPTLLPVLALLISAAIGNLTTTVLATIASLIAIPVLFFEHEKIPLLLEPAELVASAFVATSGLMFGLLFQRLRRSENQLRSLIEEASDGIFVADLSGRYTDVNSSGARMLGYGRDELVGKTILDLIPEDQVDRLWQQRQEMLHGHSEMSEWQLRCKNGDYLPVEVSAKILPDGRWQGIVRDISLRKQIEQKLRQAATVFDTTSEGILITDANAKIVAVNSAMEHITGYSREEMLGKNPRLMSSGRQDKAFYQELWKTLLQTGQWQGEIWNRRKNGEVYPAWENISVLRNEHGEISQFLSIQADISVIKQAQERLNHLAYHDALTGLPNRLLFNATLEIAINRATRRQQKLALLFLDLDRFKLINDTLGHRVGDLLLQEVGSRLRACVRAEDLVSRLGGDEFTIILEEINQPDDATPVVHKILIALSKPARLADRDITIGASIGISLFPDDGDDADDLVRMADTAMYQAKARGRNTYQFYTEALTARAAEHLALEHGVRRALEQNELCMYYQPQLELRSGRIVAAEALLRWRHPDKGLLAPGRMIAVAEESDLMEALGDWVLRDVCRQYQQWLQQGIDVPWIAVNLSGRQFLYDHLLVTLDSALRRNHLNPGDVHLEFEVTETMLQSIERSQPTLQRLRDMGFRNVIDDFGTGFSSLSLLQHLPIDLIKIAEPFIRDLPRSADNRAITTAIISLAHALRMQVVAEGVENPAQLQFLKQLDCDRVQGFYTGAVMTADALAALLQQQQTARSQQA